MNIKIRKITLSSQLMTSICLNDGLKLFSFHFNPRDFNKKSIMNQVCVCYRCYNLDYHLASKCPKESDFKVCSNSSSREHTFKKCSNQLKKCLNCGTLNILLSKTKRNNQNQKYYNSLKTVSGIYECQEFS